MSYAKKGEALSASVTIPATVTALCVLVLFCGAALAADATDIVVHPLDGQNAEQVRRDRYECHNWAVTQTGIAPAQEPEVDPGERRGERLRKVLTGAAVGAAAGSVIRGSRDHRDAGDGALAGGVLGAIAGAVIGDKDADRNTSESNEEFSDYYRALDACMSGRGYSLSVD